MTKEFYIDFNIDIKATNIELTPGLRQYIERKIGELDEFIRHINGCVKAWVEIGKPSLHHKKGNVFYVEAQIRLPGQGVRAEAKGSDLYLTIDQVKNELQRSLKKYKGKREAKLKRGTRTFKNILHLSPLARFRRKKGQRIREEGL